MSRKRRQFTREFKVEALRLVEEGGKPLAQVARELGVRADLLYSWRRATTAGAKVDEAFPGQGVRTGEAEEIRRLRRRLEQVEQERDFLKNCPGAWTAPSVGPETPRRIDSRTEWRGRLLFGGFRARKKTWSGGGCGLASGDAVRRSRLGK